MDFANENQVSTVENPIAAPLLPFVVHLFGLVPSKPVSVKKGTRSFVHLTEPKTPETNAVVFNGGLVTDFAFVAARQVEGFKLGGGHKSVSEATGTD